MVRAFLVVLVLLGATSSATAASWQDIAADCKKAAAGPGGITRVDVAFAGLAATRLALWKRLFRGQFCKRKGMHIFPYCH